MSLRRKPMLIKIHKKKKNWKRLIVKAEITDNLTLWTNVNMNIIAIIGLLNQERENSKSDLKLSISLNIWKCSIQLLEHCLAKMVKWEAGGS